MHKKASLKYDILDAGLPLGAVFGATGYAFEHKDKNKNRLRDKLRRALKMGLLGTTIGTGVSASARGIGNNFILGPTPPHQPPPYQPQRRVEVPRDISPSVRRPTTPPPSLTPPPPSVPVGVPVSWSAPVANKPIHELLELDKTPSDPKFRKTAYAQYLAFSDEIEKIAYNMAAANKVLGASIQTKTANTGALIGGGAGAILTPGGVKAKTVGGLAGAAFGGGLHLAGKTAKESIIDEQVQRDHRDLHGYVPMEYR